MSNFSHEAEGWTTLKRWDGKLSYGAQTLWGPCHAPLGRYPKVGTVRGRGRARWDACAQAHSAPGCPPSLPSPNLIVFLLKLFNFNKIKLGMWLCCHLIQLTLFFFIYFLNWRIIALQNFVVFCRISTWISHRYTYVPSLLNHIHFFFEVFFF